jgi:ribonuclease HI
MFRQVGRYHPAVRFLKLLGLMTATIDIVHQARLHMRPVQFYLKNKWRASMGLQARVMVSRKFPPMLEWWLNLENLRRGVPLSQPPIKWILTTDASGGGWGGHASQAEYPDVKILSQGRWHQSEMQIHINVLEMRAVIRALECFRDQIHHCRVLLETDNTSVVSHVRKQGGVRSWNLWEETRILFTLTNQLGITLGPIHRPGVENVLADSLSRSVIDPHEWSLHERAVRKLFHQWGRPQIDLFATAQNAKLSIFCQRLERNALLMNWSHWMCYAFPPIPLIPMTLAKIKEDRASVILIAPRWPRAPWFPLLVRQLVDIPITLPEWPDLLTQNLDQGVVRRDDMFPLHLTAWKLSVVGSEQEAFQRELLKLRYEPQGRHHTRSTTQDGIDIPYGVMLKNWIPSKQLFPRSWSSSRN